MGDAILTELEVQLEDTLVTSAVVEGLEDQSSEVLDVGLLAFLVAVSVLFFSLPPAFPLALHLGEAYLVMIELVLASQPFRGLSGHVASFGVNKPMLVYPYVKRIENRGDFAWIEDSSAYVEGYDLAEIVAFQLSVADLVICLLIVEDIHCAFLGCDRC